MQDGKIKDGESRDAALATQGRPRRDIGINVKAPELGKRLQKPNSKGREAISYKAGVAPLA